MHEIVSGSVLLQKFFAVTNPINLMYLYAPFFPIMYIISLRIKMQTIKVFNGKLL